MLKFASSRAIARPLKMSAFALALTAGTAFATPAFAQSTEPQFQGFRIEGLIGWDNEGVDYDDDVFGGGKNNQSGLLLGAAVGYDFQVSNWVFGIEGEWTESSTNKEFTGTGTHVNPLVAVPVSVDYNVKGGSDIAITGRVGYAVMPNLLLYGKAGYSWHKIAFEGTGLDNGVPFTIDNGVDLGGLRLGVGGEMNFTPMFYGKLEYRYSNYNDGDFDIRGANPTLDPLFSGIDVVRHQVVLGAGIRF